MAVGAGRRADGADRRGRRALGGALGAVVVLAVGIPLANAAATARPRVATPSVPVVVAEGCGVQRQGSGVVVAHRGVPRLLTDAHVVDGAATVEVDGAPAAVVGAVDGFDAAVVVPPDLPALRTGPPPAVGDRVVVVGHPGGVATTRPGRVVALTRRVARGDAADVVLVDVTVRGGDSGGAVLDRSGRVVALVAAADARTGRAVAYPVEHVLAAGVVPGPPGC